MILKDKYKAFTLTEVLITLTIIGVVGALCVPNLIKKSNDDETVSRLQHTYEALSEATQAIIQTYGPPTTWLVSGNAENTYNLYKEFLKTSKECKADEGGFTDPIYYLNKSTIIDWDTTGYRLKLANSVALMITAPIDTTCSSDQSENRGSKDICSYMWVDINGKKAPNTVGRDLFMFVLKKDGLYPAGCDKNEKCATNKDGFTCACQVLTEGKIDY